MFAFPLQLNNQSKTGQFCAIVCVMRGKIQKHLGKIAEYVCPYTGVTATPILSQRTPDTITEYNRKLNEMGTASSHYIRFQLIVHLAPFKWALNVPKLHPFNLHKY